MIGWPKQRDDSWERPAVQAIGVEKCHDLGERRRSAEEVALASITLELRESLAARTRPRLSNCQEMAKLAASGEEDDADPSHRCVGEDERRAHACDREEQRGGRQQADRSPEIGGRTQLNGGRDASTQ